MEALIIFVICVIYFIPAIYYSFKVDTALNYHPERIECTPKDKYPWFYAIRCFFWIFFIRKLNKLIKE